MSDVIIKKADKNTEKELKSINFDCSYLKDAVNKYYGSTYKIFHLKPFEANILKQTCLSLGFDCAVSKDTITCKCEETDCIIFASDTQYKKLIVKLKEQPFRLKKIASQLEFILNSKLNSLKLNNNLFDWSRPYIMGILNVTPDSFSDGGRYNNLDKAYNQCLKLIKDGADIIDIGGESTRPNAKPVSVDEEIKRVIPVIEKIRKNNINIPISIDTRNYKTAKLAIQSGADLINDVSGLDYDKELFKYVSQNNIPTVIMHSDKIPASSDDFSHGDVVEEIYKSLDEKINNLINIGMDRKNIIIDIGIGFGKAKEGNFELLRRINEFTGLKVPILIGISRKSFIRNTFNITSEKSDLPTAIYSAMLKDVNIHRVHNVHLTKKCIEYAKFL